MALIRYQPEQKLLPIINQEVQMKYSFISIPLFLSLTTLTYANSDKTQMIEGIKQSCLMQAGKNPASDIKAFCYCYAEGIAREVTNTDLANIKRGLLSAKTANDIRKVFDQNPSVQKAYNSCR